MQIDAGKERDPFKHASPMLVIVCTLFSIQEIMTTIPCEDFFSIHPELFFA